MSSTTTPYNLPAEVSTEEAAKILGISKDTVLRLKRAGLLEYRNAAPPSSSRPVYRFTLASVTELRTNYKRDVPEMQRSHASQRRRVRERKPSKYINIQDD